MNITQCGKWKHEHYSIIGLDNKKKKKKKKSTLLGENPLESITCSEGGLAMSWACIW